MFMRDALSHRMNLVCLGSYSWSVLFLQSEIQSQDISDDKTAKVVNENASGASEHGAGKFSYVVMYSFMNEPDLGIVNYIWHCQYVS